MAKLKRNITNAQLEELRQQPQPFGRLLIRAHRTFHAGTTAKLTALGYSDFGNAKGTLLAQLDPAQFWQIHRSVIVNHRHIASAVRIDEGNMVLTLRGRGERLPVSRHFQGLFRGQ